MGSARSGLSLKAVLNDEGYVRFVPKKKSEDNLEATSDTLLAMKRNRQAMSYETMLAANREEEDIGKKHKPRKGKKAA
jgi:hypothetical protein